MRTVKRPGQSWPKGSCQVALAACRRYEPDEVRSAVERLFDLLGGVERFAGAGERVLIKPNLIVPAGNCGPAQTHPAVILAIARRLRDAGARPMVGDSPAWQDAAACLRSLGIEEDLRRLEVPVVQLDDPVRIRIEGGFIGISRKALEADKIINVPKFKAHQQLGATFAVKNLFGCVAGKEKAFRHFTHGQDPQRFCRMLIGIYARLAPVVNIIDAVVAMEGQGPIHGTPRALRVLIGGEDPIACERVCCRIAGLEVESLPVLQTAQALNLGCSEPHLIGDRLEEFICRDFRPAARTPLRFTFPRICKSIARQLILRGRNKLFPKNPAGRRP